MNLDDLAAAKRVFKNLNKADNLTEAVVKESPRLFDLVRDTVRAFKAKKADAFSKFLPETNAFVGKVNPDIA